jgi:hypothetical protein
MLNPRSFPKTYQVSDSLPPHPLSGNPWPDEAKFKSLGYWQMINSRRALRGFGWKLFRKLGMEPDAIEELVEKAKTDITDSSLHFFFPM